MLGKSYFSYWGLLFYPLVGLLLSAILTKVCIRVLPRLGYVDEPGGRRQHERSVPRGGGIAVILAFFFTLGSYAFLSLTPGSIELFWWLLIPSVLLGALGLVDDRRELKSKLKLLVQLVVAFIVWFNLDRQYLVFGCRLPWFLSLTLTVGWVVVILNSFNLIDGLDGLAAGLAIVSAGCMATWFLLVGNHMAEAMAMLILAGTCFGFLRYNFYPARIFLGDTGSTFLGLIFAITGLTCVDRAVTATSLLLPMLVIGVPLFDVILAIWRRSARKLLNPRSGGIMEGDRDHLHHRLLRQTSKQTTTAWILYLLGCCFSAGALLLLIARNSVPAVAYILLLIAVLIAIRQLAGVELSESAQLIQNGLAKPRRGLLINLVHPFLDFSCIAAAFLIACLLACGTPGTLYFFLLTFSPLALLLCVSGVYRVYWLRAGINDYARLLLLIVFGSLVSNLILYGYGYSEMAEEYGITPWQFVNGSVLFTMINVLLILGERFCIHYAGWFWFRELSLQRQPREQQQRLLVYGGGLKCRIFVNILYCAQKSNDPARILGIIDDDPALHGLRIYGFPVFGGSGNLEKIYARHPFDKILVTACSEDAEKMARLKEFCRHHDIALEVLRIEEEIIMQAGTGPCRKS